MKKFLSLLEVLLVFILLKPLGWWLDAIGVYEWEVKNLGGWSYLGGLLLYLVPLLILIIARRDFRSYGITCKHWQQSLDLAMHVFPIKLLPWFLGIAAMFILNQDYTDLSVALILTGGYMLAIVLLFFSLNRYQQKPEPGRKTTLTNITVLAAITFAPIVINLALGRFSGRVASTVLWQLVFSGFGEELKMARIFSITLEPRLWPALQNLRGAVWAGIADHGCAFWDFSRAEHLQSIDRSLVLPMGVGLVYAIFRPLLWYRPGEKPGYPCARDPAWRSGCFWRGDRDHLWKWQLGIKKFFQI